MKKIMFNDKYGLTKAVLEGRKTMTRRVVPEKLIKAIEGGVPGFAVMESKYKFGEVVAVAQAYRDAINPLDWVNTLIYKNEPGWTNKMFVGADLMPHQIFINAVRVERLQDISDEDCLREGVMSGCKIYMDSADRECYGPTTYAIDYCDEDFSTPQSAFAALIDKISGKGTWESNPFVFVYEFELVK